MSAVQDSVRQERRGKGPAIGRRWPLLSNPVPAIGYMLSVMAGYCVLAGYELAHDSWRPRDLVVFGALIACGAVCVEATRRLGQPAGVSRDLLSAWWLPVALLLPPAYALAAPAVLGPLFYLRVRRGPVYRRAVSPAAPGLAGAGGSGLFPRAGPPAGPGQPARVSVAGAPGWRLTAAHRGGARGVLRGGAGHTTLA